MADEFTGSTAQKIADVMTEITQDRLPGLKWEIGQWSNDTWFVSLTNLAEKNTVKGDKRGYLSPEQWGALRETFMAAGIAEHSVGQPLSSPVKFEIGALATSGSNVQPSLFNIAQDEQAEKDLQWLVANKEKLRKDFGHNLFKANSEKIEEDLAAITDPAPPPPVDFVLEPGAPDPKQARPTGDSAKFSDNHLTALNNFFDEFNQTGHYQWKWHNPLAESTDPAMAQQAAAAWHEGLTFWLAPTVAGGQHREAFTVTPAGITVHTLAPHPDQTPESHANDRDKAMADSIRLAVQMYGNFNARNPEPGKSLSPDVTNRIEAITQKLLATGQLTDHQGNVLTSVKVNGVQISMPQPAAASPPGSGYQAQAPRA
jgi:hypothetical protein